MSTEPAFSAVARDYDTTFTETAVGKLQRALVWKRLSEMVPGTPTVLELNCGTGTDAVWMGQRGWQVLATDVSPEMIRVTEGKIQSAGLSHNVSARVCAFSDVGQLKEGKFDLIFSNFGGLNCISPQELASLWEVILSKLHPNGQIIAVIMGRFCWWESLYFMLKGKPSQAFRRLRRGPVEARLNDETTVTTWYYSPHHLGLPNHQHPLQTQVFPIGFWLPPSYLDPLFVKRPRWLRALNYWEKDGAPSWLAAAADHYLIQISSQAEVTGLEVLPKSS